MAFWWSGLYPLKYFGICLTFVRFSVTKQPKELRELQQQQQDGEDDEHTPEFSSTEFRNLKQDMLGRGGRKTTCSVVSSSSSPGQANSHNKENKKNNFYMLQKLRRKEFMEMFLAQQKEQQRMGVKDPKGLFQFSKACSKKSRLQAIQYAKEIHEEQLILLQDSNQQLQKQQQMVDPEPSTSSPPHGPTDRTPAGSQPTTAASSVPSTVASRGGINDLLSLADNLDQVLDLVSDFETHFTD